MKVAVLGSFSPVWSTESDLADALDRAGHEVARCDEQIVRGWRQAANADLIVWMPSRLDSRLAVTELARLRRVSAAPVVYTHLDRVFRIPQRERQLRDSAVLGCHLAITADGAHDDSWAAVGLRHRWMLPAVDARQASLPPLPLEYPVPDVIFIGSWRRYHTVHAHRMQLVEWLADRYGPAFGCFPPDGRLIRGGELVGLVRKAKVIVGDSCLAAATGMYSSDRLPELVGRGGFLVHPHVTGVTDGPYEAGVHLACWEEGDWNALAAVIDAYREDAVGRREVREAGRAHVLAHHTYDNRAATLIDICREEGLI